MIGLIRGYIDAFLISIVFYYAMTAYVTEYVGVLLVVDSLMQSSPVYIYL